MELRVLRYFLAIAREGNMTRAADYLHVTQPTLSKQIKTLEDEVGKKLFVRSNYSMKLTEEGLLLRKRAEDIISMVEKTMDEFIALDNIDGGEIYIGSSESESVKYFAQAAKYLLDRYPNVRFHLYSGNTKTVTERLDKGLLDFAIISQNVNLSKYNCLRVPALDTWGLIMRKDSPHANKKVITIEDLFNIPLIVSRQGITQDYPKWFGDRMDDLNIVTTYDLIYNATIMVKEGIGYALAFDNIIYTGDDSEFCFRPLLPTLQSSIYVIWKKYQVFSPIANLLLEIMQNKFIDESV